MREYFDSELKQLNEDLVSMANMSKEIIKIASSGIGNRDDELVSKVKPLYNDIEKKEKDIESSCLKLLLLQQPVAGDLRQISAVLKMITDLQRIGDQAENIAEMLSITNKTLVSKNEYVERMSELTINMLRDCILAFIYMDANKAKEVIAKDDEVDKDFYKIKTELIEIIHNNKEDGEYVIDILMCAKYFEKIGDHIVNMAKWIVFAVTGSHID